MVVEHVNVYQYAYHQYTEVPYSITANVGCLKVGSMSYTNTNVVMTHLKSPRT